MRTLYHSGHDADPTSLLVVSTPLVENGESAGAVRWIGADSIDSHVTMLISSRRHIMYAYSHTDM